MNVWIVNPFDSLPCEGHRPLRYWLMAEAFVRAGHRVAYWTADFNHVTKRPRSLGTLPPDGGDTPHTNCGDTPHALGTLPPDGGDTPYTNGGDTPHAGIEIIAVHEPFYEKNISLRRLLAHWRWARNWSIAARQHCGDTPHAGGDTPCKISGDSPCAVGDTPPAPDVIIVSSPPLYIGREVRKFAKRVNAKVVVDVMDAWPETFERVVPRWVLWPLRRLVRANYLGADAITVVADEYVDLLKKYGVYCEICRFYHGILLGTVPAARVGTVPKCGGSVPIKSPGCGGSVPIKSTGCGGSVPVKIVYAGNLGRTYDLKTAIEAVGLLEGVSLEIAGRGDCEDELRRFAEDPLFAGKVVFKGYLGEDGLAGFLASGDIGLVPMSPDSRVGVPYKLADYARAGLAVASSLGGESDRLLARYGAGVSYRAGDPQSLAGAVRRLIPGLAAAKAASRRLAEAEFDAARIYGDYVAFASAVAGAGQILGGSPVFRA